MEFFMKNNILNLLEEIRSIAQTGLNFTKDEYDIKRYKRLLNLASQSYSDLSGIDKNTIYNNFLNDIAYATPKVGVEGVVFSNDKLLLVRRTDNYKWCLPCGWCEINESPQQSVEREIFEETGLNVEIISIIDVLHVLAGEYNQPHTYYQIMYHCEQISGTLTPSDETSDVGFFKIEEIKDWHRNHKQIAERAFKYYNTFVKK